MTTTRNRRTWRDLRLKAAIAGSGRTQRRLSIAARIPENRLSLIVRGKRAATPREMRAIARELGRAVDELFAVNTITAGPGEARALVDVVVEEG